MVWHRVTLMGVNTVGPFSNCLPSIQGPTSAPHSLPVGFVFATLVPSLEEISHPDHHAA